jgi:DNA polymerase I-like protein with 3'-5' exonuclease and polymerase domains
MKKVALIDKYDSHLDYTKYFDFEFDKFHLCEENLKRVLKKDIVLDYNPIIEEYDFIILVGADVCKHVAKISSVTKYQGYLVENKFLPITNPAMLAFKPEGTNAFNKAVQDIKNYIDGNIKEAQVSCVLISDEDELLSLLYHLYSNTPEVISLDSETSALYPRNGYVLGISLAYENNRGYYISADCITETAVELLQKIFNKTKVVFHNAKFDISFFKYHFGWNFDDFEDTMLMHYILDEKVGTHGLKELAITYTDLGDYDRELEEYKATYCKQHGIKAADFTYDLIPFDVLGVYAAKDGIATFRLFGFFKDRVYGSDMLRNAYRNLLIEGTKFLIKVENNGVPIDRERLKTAQVELSHKIEYIYKEFYNYDEIGKLEQLTGKLFNPNSVQQLRDLFFSLLGLPEPSKRTGTGQLSTDAEVLTELAKLHPLAELVLDYKKALKIKNTYLDKMAASLDADGRLRTSFNLTTTTSGRLSSSGKLNMQQLPRDDKTVKYCIKAREGYVIISQDLTTAEMYVVAVLSGDKNLQRVFQSGGDFHSSVAHMVFKLDCKVEEVKKLYPELRQAAKAISFGINQ